MRPYRHLLQTASNATDHNSKAIDPPKLDAINAAWQTLQDLGAVEGEDHKSRLTALGRHVSKGIIIHSDVWVADIVHRR